MAKALFGHLGGTHDGTGSGRLAGENARLRARVAELEALVLRLSEENDALAAAHAAQVERELDHALQPA